MPVPVPATVPGQLGLRALPALLMLLMALMALPLQPGVSRGRTVGVLAAVCCVDCGEWPSSEGERCPPTDWR